MIVDIFSYHSDFHDLGRSLPAFTSRTTLKLLNVPVTAKVEVITAVDSSKASGPYCIPLVVL